MKRLFVLFITIFLCFSLFSITVFAEETDDEKRARWILEREYHLASDDVKADFSYYIQCHLSEEDFEFLCRVVSKEAGPENEAGCEAVACCIFNRVDDSNFPDTVHEVLVQSGQFSTVINGECEAEVTDNVRQAVTDAYLNRSLPETVLYFRADCYFPWVKSYKEIDGNYFSYG